MHKLAKQLVTENLYTIVGTFIITSAMILAIFVVRNITIEPVSDFLGYYKNALRIADGHLAFTPFKPVGYNYLLGIWMRITNDTSVNNAKLLNLVLYGLSLILSLRIGNLAFSRLLSRIIWLILFSFSPIFIFYLPILGIETPVLTILTAILVAHLEKQIKPVIRCFTIGVLCALLASIRVYFLLLPLILGFSEFLEIRHFKKSLYFTIASSCIMFILLSPLTYMCYITTGSFMLVPSNSSTVLFLNNNDSSTTGRLVPMQHISKTPELEGELAQLDDQSRPYQDALRREAIKWICENPAEFTKLGVLRLKQIFFTDNFFEYTFNEVRHAHLTQDQKRSENMVVNLLSIIQSWLGILGLGIVFTNFSSIVQSMRLGNSIDKIVSLPVLLVLFQLGIYFASEGQPRYYFYFHLPILLALTGSIQLRNSPPIRFTEGLTKQGVS